MAKTKLSVFTYLLRCNNHGSAAKDGPRIFSRSLGGPLTKTQKSTFMMIV